MKLPWLGIWAVMLSAIAGVAAESPAGDSFGKNIELAPFVVNGKKLSISIHARTKADRAYAQKFAEEVVGIAYETMGGESTGSGLVIIGREGEPHPVAIMQQFLELAAKGRLDPGVRAKLGDVDAKLTEWRALMRMDQAPEAEEGFKLTFDMIVPALPLPLEGPAAKLYQIAWAENFEPARVERKLRSLTVADLEADAFKKYDWAFYLPPRDAYLEVQNAIMKAAMKHEKMGVFKRTAIRSALFVFKPAIKKAVEGFRQGMLFMAVLRAQSGYNKEDIRLLTEAYTQVLMPDFKFNGGSERQRALEAIAAQKERNAEYAKDPYVSPPRLATFDATAYTACEGAYGPEEKDKKGQPLKPRRTLVRQEDGWRWEYRHGKPQTMYPAGARLLVSADGKFTIEFKADAQGAITAVEERRERFRETFPHATQGRDGKP